VSNRTDPLSHIPDTLSTTNANITPPEPIEFDFPLVSQRSEADLKEFDLNMLDDYRDFKREVLSWLATRGKDPEKGDGLSRTTIKSTHYKLETVFRWLWSYEGSYSTNFTPEHADRFIDLLNQTDSMIDSTVLHHAKDIKRFFKFTNHVYGTDYEWEPKHDLSQSNGSERSYLRRNAFQPLYEAALDYGSMKSYHSDMSSQERDRLRTYISQRFGVPKANVGPEEFKKANSWKVPSMIAVALDTGLRPIEVGRAKVSWVNLEDNELNIPEEDSTKNDGHWNCSLQQRTTTSLERWLSERESYDKYTDRTELWLTKRATPYSKDSCNYLLNRLLEDGSVPTPPHQDVSWYTIRHGVATYWANHVGPHHAKEQLRHKSLNTTMKYLHSDAETRNSAVEHIW